MEKSLNSVNNGSNEIQNAHAHVCIIAKKSANLQKTPTKDVAIVLDTSFASGTFKLKRAVTLSKKTRIKKQQEETSIPSSYSKKILQIFKRIQQNMREDAWKQDLQNKIQSWKGT